MTHALVIAAIAFALSYGLFLVIIGFVELFENDKRNRDDWMPEPEYEDYDNGHRWPFNTLDAYDDGE